MKLRMAFLSGLLFVTSGTAYGQNLSGQVAEANRLYREGKFEEARNRYLEALKQQPELAQLHFNLGDALYKSRDYEKALESFQESLRKADPELQADSWYNLGNALFRQGELQKSLEAYKESLKLDPSDSDTKHNLEYVLRQIQQQPPQNQQDQDQNEPDPSEQNQQDQQSSESQSKQEQEEEEQQHQEAQQNESQQQESQGKGEKEPASGQQQASSGEQEEDSDDSSQRRTVEQMSPEEVKRLLDALKEDPEQFLKRKVLRQSTTRVKKDW